MKKRTSIKDVAAALDVSVTTVSFVLNGKGKEKKISQEVTKKILEYVKKINYKPNQLAKSLRTGDSNLLVFMVEDISNTFFSKLARLIEDVAYQKGYKVIFCSNENLDEKSIELIDVFVERQVDGFIIIPSAGIRSKIESLVKQGIPVVLFDRYFPGLDISYVGINNESASFMGVEHLVKNGFKRIGFITIALQQTQMKDRLSGYKRAVKDFGVPESYLEVPYGSKFSKKRKEMITEFLAAHPELDAIFFSTNYLTRMGLEVLKEAGPESQKKFGILTFDDNELFKIYTPSISAVCQPLEEMATEVMEILLELIKSKTPSAFKSKKVELETTLAIRESTSRNLVGQEFFPHKV